MNEKRAWFRLYAEFATDPKVQSMSETFQRRFIMLLCYKCNDDLQQLSEEELAFAMRIDAEELKKTKEALLKKGFIDQNWVILNWDKRQFKSDSSSDRVRLHREKKKSGIKDEENETLQKRCRSVTETAPDTDTESDTESDTELKEKNNKKEKPKSNSKKTDAVQKVFDHWRNVMGHRNAALDGKRKKRMEGWLVHYTVDELCEAITGCTHSDWHMGRDPKNQTKYTGIEHIFKSADNIDKFIQMNRNPPIPTHIISSAGRTTMMAGQSFLDRLNKQGGNDEAK